MIRSLLARPWRRCLAVALLSVPFALGLRALLREVFAPTLAEAAAEYVRSRDVLPLSEPLARILSDPAGDTATQDHPLLGRAAPDFCLPDDGGRAVRLADLRRGPVVVVFYYGYDCTHCVAQLFALDKDAALFRELGAEVVAISADPPENTAGRFREFGRFRFPVLSDRRNRTAEVFGLYTPPAGDQPEDLQHGTFVVGADGTVRWAYRGRQPFLDNRTLLREAARSGSPRDTRSVGGRRVTPAPVG